MVAYARTRGRNARFVCLVSLALMAMMGFGTTAMAAEPPPAVCASAPYLAYVNTFRALANVPALTEDTTTIAGGAPLAVGDCNHSRYVVKDTIRHDEDPANPWYTAAGNAAGQRGNVAIASGPYTYQDAIDSWMTGPFHAVNMLYAGLTQTAFGFYTESGVSGATLDVFDTNGPTPITPTLFPADQKMMPLTRYNGGEAPDPLTPCMGFPSASFLTPTGPPIILQLTTAPGAVSGSLTLNGGAPLPVCTYTGATYTNADPSFQQLGQAILNARKAVVLFPRDPLTNGIYTVTINASGGPYTWTFAVGLQSITVSPGSISTLSETQFTATGTFAGGNGITSFDLTPYVTWASTNTMIATVNATGAVTPLMQGTTAIIAAFGTISGQATLTSLHKPSSSVPGNPVQLPGQRPTTNPAGAPAPLPSPR
jgi:hypothetical protein